MQEQSLSSSSSEEKDEDVAIDLTIYAYPPNTTGADASSGFFTSLNSEQREKLRRTRLWMREHQLSPKRLTGFALHPDLTLLRYLRANKFDTEQATQHIARNVAWREESCVNTLLELSPEEILGCSMEEYQKYLPHWHCGYDKTGRPVIYKQYGSFENNLLGDLSGIENVTRYHIWEQEVISKLCHDRSRLSGQVVETSFAIMDLEGMQLRQVTKDFLAIVKAFANIDQTQYPETLGRLCIINAPAAFPYVWSWVKPWLDPVVASKIQIFSGQSTWQPAFFDLIGKEHMPQNYGGHLPRLTSETPPYRGFERGYRSPETAAPQTPLPPAFASESVLNSSTASRGLGRRGSFRRAPSVRVAIEHSSSAEATRSPNSTVLLGSSVDGLPDEHSSARPVSFALANVTSARLVSPLTAMNRFSIRFPTEHMLKYPEGTPGSDAPDGYVFSLTPAQTTALKEVQQWMQEERVDVNDLVEQTLHPNLTLLRYLRANKFDVEAATQHIKRNAQWRKEHDVNQLSSLSPERILECSLATYQTYLPHWHCGHDKTGRPVIYKQYGSFENTLLNHSSIENVTRYHIWEQEVMGKLCYSQSRKRGQIVETSFAIMDLEGMQMRQVTSDFLAIVKAFAGIDQAQYPETLGKLFIINAPALFPFVWRGVKSFLDPVVTGKIQIFGGQATWQPVLFELIGKENMPQNYGGDLPLLTSESPPYILPSVSDHAGRAVRRALSGSRLDLEVGGLGVSGGEDEDTASVDSSAFYDAVEQQEVEDVFNIVAGRENFLSQAARSVFVLKAVTDLPLPVISRLFSGCLAVYLVATFVAMTLSAYAMHSAPWVENTYGAEKWTAIVIVLISFFLFVVIFIGYTGCVIRNFFMLDFFAGCAAIGSALYLIVSVATFYYYGRDVNGSSINTYRLGISIIGLLLFVLGVGPILLARALSYRCKVDLDKRLKPQQLRIILRTINCVSICFAVGMVVYGGTSMKFLHAVNINISSTVYSVFGLIYCGVTILLSGLCGLWVSITTRRNVVRFFFLVFQPLLMLMLTAAAIVSFYNLSTVDSYSTSDFKTSTYNKDYIISQIYTELLIAGILFIFCGIFQLISMWVSRKLIAKLDQDFRLNEGQDSRFKYTNTALTVRKRSAARTWKENSLILYGLVGGLFCLYFKGTFVIFADFVHDDNKTYTLNWLSNFWFGGIDPRYENSDAYILASEGTLAVIVGPIMLLYSWATFVRAPFRHILGIIVCTALIYNTFLYYGIEIRRNVSDIDTRGEGVLAITILIDLLVGFVTPSVILVFECSVLSRNSSKAYSKDPSKLAMRVGRTRRTSSSAHLTRGRPNALSVIMEDSRANSVTSLTGGGGGRSRTESTPEHATRVRRHSGRSMSPAGSPHPTPLPYDRIGNGAHGGGSPFTSVFTFPTAAAAAGAYQRSNSQHVGDTFDDEKADMSMTL